MKTAINFTIFFLIIAAAAVTRAQTTNLPPPTPYSVAHRDANSEVLQQTFYTTSRTGKAIPHVRSVTKIETGLNYWDGTTWRESNPSFQVSQNGQYVYANEVQTKVRLSANLAASNSVSITTPDGIVLNTTPVAVGLYDAASGNSLIIAAITNCSGTLISSNQVLYDDVFDGISGDILYTLKRGSFSQDVIWKQDFDPADYGFPTNTTRIQIFTAFNSPAPKQTARPLRVEKNQAIRSRMASPDFIDHTLKFGQLKFGPGRAYSASSTNRFEGTPVAKDFATINGQSYLVESVEYDEIKNDLQSLPRAVISSANPTKHQSRDREEAINLPGTRAKGLKLLAIPMPQTAAKATFAIKNRKNVVAQALEPKGVIADYVALPATEPDPMVFQGDTTYFVDGDVDLDNAIFEGGSVIKYPNDTNASIEVDWSLTCDTKQYLPCIFTSADDDSVGQSMNGIWANYTGTVQAGGYANPALNIQSYGGQAAALNNLRISDAVIGIYSQGDVTVTNLQIINCGYGFYLYYEGNSFYENVLLANVNCAFGGYETAQGAAENVTVANCGLLLGDDSDLGVTFCFYNSILADVTNTATFNGDWISGSNNGLYNFNLGPYVYPDNFGGTTISTWPFQTAGGGDYYLADDTLRGKGTTNNIDPALLVDLAQRTTWPPIVYDATDISSLGTLRPQAPRDTNSAPDIGYHYPSVDYLVAGCDLESNLTVTAGTTIGYYFDGDPTYGAYGAIYLRDGANLSFNGTVTQPCIFARTTMVQEGGSPDSFEDNTWTPAPVCFHGSGTSSLPFLSANFTKWESDAFAGYIQDDWAPGAGSLVNCEFYNTGVAAYDVHSLNFTNCLFFRAPVSFWDQDIVAAFCFDNCTFYEGGVAMCRYSYQTPEPWTIENCSFDGTAFVWADNLNGTSYTYFNYNAYNTNNLSWQSFPAFSWNSGTLEVVGPDDVMVTNYNWESSWFGDFYLPQDSPLIEKGSTNANFLGLYHFTTLTNQVPDGTNIVTIGYHYVATDQYGIPLDSNGDGIPDYLEDPAGNGSGNWDTTMFLNVNITQPQNGSTIP